MRNRRDFITAAAGATAGILVSGHRFAEPGLAARQVGAKPGKRREVTIGGRRVKTVDLHAHCFVPEVMELVKDTPLAATVKGNLTGNIVLGNAQRLIDMDAQGIDYQAINVNAWGYPAERALATDIVALQNERISQWCAKHPDRFVGMATAPRTRPEAAARSPPRPPRAPPPAPPLAPPAPRPAATRPAPRPAHSGPHCPIALSSPHGRAAMLNASVRLPRHRVKLTDVSAGAA